MNHCFIITVFFKLKNIMLVHNMTIKNIFKIPTKFSSKKIPLNNLLTLYHLENINDYSKEVYICLVNNIRL